MGGHYEDVPLRPESRTVKVQSKFVSCDQFEKCRFEDLRTNLSEKPEKKLENSLSERKKIGRRLKPTDFCLGARFLRFCTLYLEDGKKIEKVQKVQ